MIFSRRLSFVRFFLVCLMTKMSESFSESEVSEGYEFKLVVLRKLETLI